MEIRTFSNFVKAENTTRIKVCRERGIPSGLDFLSVYCHMLVYLPNKMGFIEVAFWTY